MVVKQTRLLIAAVPSSVAA